MADIAKLKIVVDSQDAEKGEKALKDFAKGADHAATSLIKLEKYQKAQTNIMTAQYRELKKVTAALQQQQGATSRVAQSNDKMAQSTSRLGAATGRLTAGVTSLVSAYTLMQSLNISSEYQGLQARVKLITRETNDYAASSQRLYEISKRTGSALKGNVDVYQRLAWASRGLGRSNEDALQVVENVNKLGAISGASPMALQAGLLQFGQGLSGPHFYAEEWNSIREQLPAVVQAIKDGMGITDAQLTRMVKSGKLLSSEVFEAILKQTDQINADFKSIPDNFSRGIGRVGLAIQKVLGEGLQSSGINTVVVKTLNGISDALDRLVDKADVVTIGIGGIGVAITAAGGAMALLGGPAALIAFSAISAATVALVWHFEKLKSEIENTQHVTITFGDYAKSAFYNVRDAVRPVIDLIKLLGDAVSWTTNKVSELYEKMEAIKGFDQLKLAADIFMGGKILGPKQGGGFGLIDNPFNTPSPSGNSPADIARQRILEQDKSLRLIKPVQGSLTGHFGEHRSTGVHNGIDIAAPMGAPVSAAYTGTVIFAGSTPAGGNTVLIRGKYGDKVLQQGFAHLSRIDVKKGDTVYSGSRIGAVGSTGRSTGPHLHHTLKLDGRLVDPSKYYGVSRATSSAQNMVATENKEKEAAAKRLADYKELLAFEETWAKKKQASIAISQYAYNQTVKEYEAAKAALASKQDLEGAEYAAIVKRQQALKDVEQTITDIQAKREANYELTKAIEARASYQSGGEYGLKQFLALSSIKSQIGNTYDTSTGIGADLLQKAKDTLDQQRGLEMDKMLADATSQYEVEKRLTDARERGVEALRLQVIHESVLAQLKDTGVGVDSSIGQSLLSVAMARETEIRKREQLELSEATQRSIQYQRDLKAAYESKSTFNQTTLQFEKSAIDQVNDAYEIQNQLMSEKLQKGTEAYNMRLKELQLEKQAQRETTAAAESSQQSMQMQQQLTETFSNAFVDAIINARSLQDVMKSLMQDVTRMLLNKFVTSLFGGIFGSIIPSAHGNVFHGGRLVPFASGGIVSSPTMFPLSGGSMGLMGEAGHEAIMPLRRDSKGNLGVVAAGGGGGTVINVTNNIQMSSSGDRQYDQDMIERTTKAINGGIRATITDENRRQLRPGGMFRGGNVMKV